MIVYHGLSSETGWKYGLKDCAYICLPYNYILGYKIPRYILEALRKKNWLLDSGAARYFLNNGYPEFPFPIDQYLQVVDEWQPTFFASMDYATENFKFWDWVDRTIEKNYLIWDKWIQLGLSSLFMPIIQGFSPASYRYCAEECRDLIRSSTRYGIGSVCRASPSKLKETLQALAGEVNFQKAHLFGQTVRTIPIALDFGIGYIDTANATTNAAFKVINTRDGKWYYSQRSKKKRKHNLDHLGYDAFFQINRREIEAVATKNFGLWRY